jgi:hypothetical protein
MRLAFVILALCLNGYGQSMGSEYIPAQSMDVQVIAVPPSTTLRRAATR